jgi:hypothetical protein
MRSEYDGLRLKDNYFWADNPWISAKYLGPTIGAHTIAKCL